VGVCVCVCVCVCCVCVCVACMCACVLCVVCVCMCVCVRVCERECDVFAFFLRVCLVVLAYLLCLLCIYVQTRIHITYTCFMCRHVYTCIYIYIYMTCLYTYVTPSPPVCLVVSACLPCVLCLLLASSHALLVCRMHDSDRWVCANSMWRHACT